MSGASLDAYWLPGLDSVPLLPSSPIPSGRSGLHFAATTPASIGTQVDALRMAADGLLDRDIDSIIRSVDLVARRILDRADPLRRVAMEWVPEFTGFSEPMVEVVLDRMASDWCAERLEQLLKGEFGAVAAVDRFVDRAGVQSHVVGPRVVVHVCSGNVPGIGVTSMIRALLVKGTSLVKTASGEPILAPLFARALAEVDEELGRCLAVTYWPRTDSEHGEAAVSRADVVIAYGSDEAVEALRRQTPTRARFLGYGHRLSFAVVAREALTSDGATRTAAEAARAVATFDQQGCVSPHLIYAEAGGEVEPVDFARRLAGELDRLAAELPRGRLDAHEASAIVQARAAAQFAGFSGGGQCVHMSAPGTDWTVVYDPAPGFEASCLNRFVRVKPVVEISEVVHQVKPFGSVLQSVGVAGPPARIGPLARALARVGVTRVAPLLGLPWPSAVWRHDGRPPLGDLVHWCDWEG